MKTTQSALATVPGGQFEAAVTLIRWELECAPTMSAQAAVRALDQYGMTNAADMVRTFASTDTAGSSPSARSAALFLILLDSVEAEGVVWESGPLMSTDSSSDSTAGGSK